MFDYRQIWIFLICLMIKQIQINQNCVKNLIFLNKFGTNTSAYYPAVRPSGYLAIMTSGHPVVRASGCPAIWLSGHPVVWPSGHPSIWLSGHLIVRPDRQKYFDLWKLDIYFTYISAIYGWIFKIFFFSERYMQWLSGKKDFENPSIN